MCALRTEGKHRGAAFRAFGIPHHHPHSQRGDEEEIGRESWMEHNWDQLAQHQTQTQSEYYLLCLRRSAAAGGACSSQTTTERKRTRRARWGWVMKKHGLVGTAVLSYEKFKRDYRTGLRVWYSPLNTVLSLYNGVNCVHNRVNCVHTTYNSIQHFSWRTFTCNGIFWHFCIGISSNEDQVDR